MGVGIGGRGLGGMTGMGGWVRNSSAVGMLFSRVNKESNLQARVSVVCCWGTVVSSLSSSEGKKLDDGWFKGVLGKELGCEGSCQLELFEVEMVAVYEGTMSGWQS